MVKPRRFLSALAVAVAIVAGPAPAAAETVAERHARLLGVLVAAYPDHLASHDGATLVWKDGTRMAFDDGRRDKSFEQRLDAPDIEDQFHAPYKLGRAGTPPGFQIDPGRVRYQPFFDKMYGDCRKGEVSRNLVDVIWLPRHGGQRLKVTRVNGVAERLRAVSAALEALPPDLIAYLEPSAGTYNCRPIAGTGRVSAHGHGIAIDIAVARANYWRWTKPDAAGRYPYRNRVPWEIVEIFEAHGFVWGGKWYHYDTMHFEYRPELIAASRGGG